MGGGKGRNCLQIPVWGHKWDVLGLKVCDGLFDDKGISSRLVIEDVARKEIAVS
jgi:hypothetical protein